MSLHIPYRNSKLTLLLKDAFELKSNKHCKTVIFANVAPSLCDMAMTKNTLRFITPIKIGNKRKPNQEELEPNPKDPQTWTNEMLREWVTETMKKRTNPDKFCPFETGMQILRLTESDFIERLVTINPKLSEKAAKEYYLKLWKLFIEARTAKKYSIQKGEKANAAKRKKEREENLLI